jgi:hypothetical protein
MVTVWDVWENRRYQPYETPNDDLPRRALNGGRMTITR